MKMTEFLKRCSEHYNKSAGEFFVGKEDALKPLKAYLDGFIESMDLEGFEVEITLKRGKIIREGFSKKKGKSRKNSARLK